MSEAGTTVPGGASVPEGLVSSVVNLVGTGPVLLGAYTIAELAAVDAIVDFLEARPSDEVLAEAVRSLAARQLLVAGPPGEQVQVRGDLGIAVAFQQRARMVLDARVTGTQPGEPWRILLLPQPERICLVVRIDALGIHELGLYTSDEALGLLNAMLPRGPRADAGPAGGGPAGDGTAIDGTANGGTAAGGPAAGGPAAGGAAAGGEIDRVLAAAERSALVTVTPYTTDGSAEVAGASTDLVLARHEGRLHVFHRDPDDHGQLVPGTPEGKDVRDTLVSLLS
jgi:hypothetical protein